jgi:hypothetical protein
MDTPVSLMVLTQAREVENVALLVSVWEHAKGLTQKITLLEGELVEVR